MKKNRPRRNDLEAIMNWKNLIRAAAGLLLAGVWSNAARADSLDVTLVQADQTVTLGTTMVVFDATISNPSSTDTIFLNGDGSSIPSSFLTLDDSPFFNNAPIFLDPGASTLPFELFDILLAPNTPVGTYGLNTFSIFGGADGGAGTAFNDLADANFSITVANPTSVPEPSTLLLLGSGLASFIFLRKKVSQEYRVLDHFVADLTCRSY
jgi:hypothetical protein